MAEYPGQGGSRGVHVPHLHTTATGEGSCCGLERFSPSLGLSGGACSQSRVPKTWRVVTGASSSV